MSPASPVIAGVDEIVFAKDQPKYLPLPGIRTNDGRVITRWRMTWWERLKTLLKGDIYLEVQTFGKVQPVRLSTDAPEVE